MKILLNAGLIHGECKNIEGKTISENLKEIPDKPPENQYVIRDINNPLYKKGHLAILKGILEKYNEVGTTQKIYLIIFFNKLNILKRPY